MQSVSRRSLSGLCRECPIRFWPAIPEKLPNLSHFHDHIQVEIGHDNFIPVTTRLRNNLAPRVAKVTLAIKLADAPRLLDAHPIDCSHKISVRHRVSRLLQLPKIFGESCDRGRRIEHNFRSEYLWELEQPAHAVANGYF